MTPLAAALSVPRRLLGAGPLAELPPLGPVRRAIAGSLRSTLSDRSVPPVAFDQPAGDPGLFGPDSVVWQVHADLPAMLVGGIAALALQTLHPLAMAGVADHSAFRTDPLGRLQRTAAFLGVTTYGSTPAAEEAIATVRRVHRSVVGTAPDGRRYRAGDPALLTWIHVAEVCSFSRAYQRYGGAILGPGHLDRYYRETAVVARRLGAGDVPASLAEVRRYLTDIRPELVMGAQAGEAIRFLTRGPFGAAPAALAYAILLQAAIGILPRWAQAELGLHQPALAGAALVRPSATVLGEVLRWALGPSPVLAIARQRALAPATAGA